MRVPQCLSAFAILVGLLAMQTAYAQNIPQGDASLNWAGYVADSGAQYTSVTGSWVVPNVTNIDSSGDATWVGIGGVRSNDLIQAGTQAIVENGTVAYSAWVETLPDFAQTVNLQISPGDSITATVSLVSGNIWQVTIKNNTTDQSYSNQLQYDSSFSSAEWIEEMVSNGNGSLRPLDSFGTVNFTGGSTVVDGQTQSIAQSGAHPLQLISRSGDTLATVSPLGTDGASFTVSRVVSAPAPAVQQTTPTTAPEGTPSTTIYVHRGHHYHRYTITGHSYTFSIPGFSIQFIQL